MTACCGGKCGNPPTCGCATSTEGCRCQQGGCSTNAAKPAVALSEFLTLASGELTAKQRFVFECRHGLRDCDQMSLTEIAGLMGVNKSTVSRILRDATATLQQVAQRFLIC